MAQLVGLAWLLLLSLIVSCAAEPVRLRVSVSRTASGQPEVVQLQQDDREQACATGVYQKEYTRLGWNFLQIATSESCPDHDQAYAAGYVEGVLTWEITWDHWQNTKGELNTTKELLSYLAENDMYMRGKVVAKHENEIETAYWWQVSLILEQLKALAAGYNAAAPSDKQLPLDAFLRMNSDGDFYDLIPALKTQKKKDVVGGSLARKFGVLQQTVKQALGFSAGSEAPDADIDWEDFNPHLPQKCAGLVKVLPDSAELFVSQAAFSILQELLRIYKHYDFAYHMHAGSADVIPGRRASFSSFPAHLTSGDDFYLLSSGLVALETTINTFNDTLYREYVKPTGSVFAWLRNLVANRLATTGADWTAIFSKYNSGTYNNQWLIVDYNLFESGQPLKDGTLYVLEQFPGFIATYDATEQLRTLSYYASYNCPQNQTAYEYGGNPMMAAKYGDIFTIDKDPRALQNAEQQAKVTDIDSFKYAIRYNDFKRDPLARYPENTCDYCVPDYNGEFAISSRGDLNPVVGIYPFELEDLNYGNHASLDAKVTSGALFKSFSSIVVAGPTCDQQPPFDWSTSRLKDLPHQGHVTKFAFPWVRVDWESLNGATLTLNSTECSAYW